MESQLYYIGGERSNLGHTVDHSVDPICTRGKGFAAALPYNTAHGRPTGSADGRG